MKVARILGCMLLCLPGIAAAQSWQVDSFTATYQLEPSGSMAVSEEIQVLFQVPKHGIYRKIPQQYETREQHPWLPLSLGIDLQAVTNGAGQRYQVKTTRADNAVVWRVGDPDITLTGAATYKIDYTVDRTIRYLETGDEWYWNINGVDWDAPFGSTKAVIRLPADLAGSLQETICYTGQLGSTEQDCRIVRQGGEVTVYANRELGIGENLSVALRFPVGTFAVITMQQRLLFYLITAWGLVLPLLLLPFLLRYWRRYGKDPRHDGTVPVEFEPPAGLTPAEVGTLADFSLDKRDITATLVDLAVSGYLTIIEHKKSWAFGKTDYEFQLKKTDFSQLKAHERLLLNAFKEKATDQSVKMSDLTGQLPRTVLLMRSAVNEALEQQQLVVPHMHRHQGAVIGIGVFCVFVGFMLFAPGLISAFSLAGFIAAGVLSFGFAPFMTARTKKGYMAWRQAEGLKKYLQNAEKDRLATLQSADTHYRGDTTRPAFTLDLFEKLLPFAMVYRVEKSWTGAFSDVLKEAPQWYSGSGNFDVVHLTDSLHSMTSAINTATSSSGSSGSGFSGGSSGGGFGGGGGGSW